ncbi:MAG: type II secretion system protein M [Gemmatimonadales bacterium]|nr:type II secretion system protein M [Gemmatimonadales bacterium]
MSRSRSLSAWFRRLSRRERRVVAAGALVSTLALSALWVVLPLVARWQDREVAIEAKEGQLARLRALVEAESTTRKSLSARLGARPAVRERLLTGATPALAASELQALLQGYADGSRVTLTRVDLVAQPGAAGAEGLPAIPVRLSAHSDIYGLAGLLSRLQYGEKLLVIDEFTVNAGAVAGDRPDLLTFSVRLHGAYSAK